MEYDCTWRMTRRWRILIKKRQPIDGALKNERDEDERGESCGESTQHGIEETEDEENVVVVNDEVKSCLLRVA